ncbi:MAG: hypothetical protein AAFR02_00040 [Pseudomonadota bacterium]
MDSSKIHDPFADDDAADAFAASFKPAGAGEIDIAKPAKSSALKAADSVAAKQGFSSRKRKTKPKFRRSDNFRTGRSELLSIKTRAEDKAKLAEITEQREWVNGQTLQYALDALQEKINNPQDPFWETHNFHGVD